MSGGRQISFDEPGGAQETPSSSYPTVRIESEGRGESSLMEETPQKSKVDITPTIAEVVASAMKEMKSAEKGEIAKFRGQEKLSKFLTSALAQGTFKGKKRDKILGELLAHCQYIPDQQRQSNRRVMKLVDSTLTESVRPLVVKHSAFPYEWETFVKAMKEEFRLEDADAVTQSSFMAWVFDRKRPPLGPRELLREFKAKVHQLSTDEEAVVELQALNLFMRAADPVLREELEVARDMAELQGDSSGWKEIKKLVVMVANLRKRRELSRDPLIVVNPTSSLEPVKAEASELKSAIQSLTDLVAKSLALGRGEAPKGDKRTDGVAQYPCMYCDQSGHLKRDCVDLQEAVSKALVKYVGEPGKRKIAFPNGEVVPFNNGKGGMKALVEQRAKNVQGTQSGQSSVSEAHVYNVKLENSDSASACEKRRLADLVRSKSGWNDPVFISNITVKVGAKWDAEVEVLKSKKSRDNQEGAPRT